MLRSRVIPSLLLRDGGLVKTVRFANPKYVGDPLNAVRIFNEKEVDELIISDISATVDQREPDYRLISQIASQCRMPLCYSGGITSLDQIQRIIGLGVEKVGIGSAAISNPHLLEEASACVGSQSIVGILDVKKSGLFSRYQVVSHNSKRQSGFSPADLALKYQSLGAGEILLVSVDRDGTMHGYDHTLIKLVRDAVSVPLSVLGGASSLQDIRELVTRYGLIGAAAGSLFVFKGKYRAVLIQYPSSDEKLFLSAIR